MTKLFRIGEFARLGRVSVKALRFYEREGLLEPEQVDSQTGYRYYTLRQLESLALIANLRAAGFAIADIAALVRADGDLAAFQAAIEKQRRRLSEERAAIARHANVLEALSRSLKSRKPDCGIAMRLTRIEPQLVHSRKRRVASLGAPIAEMFEEAEALVARADARAPQAPFLIYHDMAPHPTVEVCIPVLGPRAALLETHAAPGYAQACSLLYAGDYGQTEPLRRKMDAWIADAGLRKAAPLREVYHRFGADQTDYTLPASMTARSNADFLTELQLPFAID